jgi:hypothetical protein
MGDVLGGSAAEGTTTSPLSTAHEAVSAAPAVPAPAAPAPEPPPPAPEPPASPPDPPAATVPHPPAPEPPASPPPAPDPPAATAPHPTAPEPPAPDPPAADPPAADPPAAHAPEPPAPQLPVVESPHAAAPEVSLPDVPAVAAPAADPPAADAHEVSLPDVSDMQAPDLAPPALTDTVVANAGHAPDGPLITEPPTPPAEAVGLSTPATPIADPLADAAPIVQADVAAPSLPDPLSDLSVVPPVDDVMQAVSDTAGAASPLTDTLVDPGLVAPADVAAPSLPDPLSDLSVVPPVDDVMQAVSGALGDPGLVAPVDGLASGVADAVVVPFTSSVVAVPSGLGDGVDALVAPFTTTVGESVGALVGTVPAAVSIDPFTVPVEPSTSAGAAPVDAAAAPATMDGGHAADRAPQQSLADGVATTAVPGAAGTSAPDVGPFAPHGGLGVDGIDLPGGLGNLGSSAAAHASDPFAGSDPAIASPGDLAPFDGPPISGADGSSLPVAPPGVDSDSVLGVVAHVGQDTRLVAAAAIMTFAAASVIGPRAGGSGADARMAFTNVRLLPCLLKESAGRQLTAITQGLAPAAAPASAALSEGAAAGSSTIRDATTVKAEHAEGFVPRIVSELTEGFGRATREATDGAAHGLSDTRLVVQVGMLLGIVYLAFLSVWFWATRARTGMRA